MKKYVYALDLSLNSTGVAIFTNDGRFVETLTIDTSSETETKMKLKMIGKELLKLLKVYIPEVVVIEQGFTRFNTSTQQLYRVHGLVNYLFFEYEQIYYPATTIRKTVGGNGSLNKDEIRDFIKAKFPKIRFQSYDESDAFAVGLAYFMKRGVKNAEKNTKS